jgi:hypothetical protein
LSTLHGQTKHPLDDQPRHFSLDPREMMAISQFALWVWDTHAGRINTQFEEGNTDSVTELTFNTSQTLLASRSWMKIVVWNVPQGTPAASIDLEIRPHGQGKKKRGEEGTGVEVAHWDGGRYRTPNSYGSLLRECGFCDQHTAPVYRSPPAAPAVADFQAELAKRDRLAARRSRWGDPGAG